MKRSLLAFLVMLLAGCSTNLSIPRQLSSPPSEPLPSSSIIPTPLPLTLTPLPSPTEYGPPTFIPSGTLTKTPSPTPTWTSTTTSLSWSYVFPIQPSSEADFSESVVSHGYPATDIFAPEGSKFVAVTNGVVDFVSSENLWEPVMDNPASRGGLCVAIIGDDGVRYYGSHLSAIQPGITPGLRISKGQVLGRVGNSGDARNSPFHLHFGISHPTQPDDWRVRRGEIDPFSYLLAWREGRNLTPNLADIVKHTVSGTPSLYTYVFPVQPAKNASFSVGGHGYPATDIFVPAGSQFVAVTNGMVDNISLEDRWDPLNITSGSSGGKWVSILGDDGIRYYGAHLSVIVGGIQIGVRVRVGDLLGLVGNSGDARDTLPHLHFEISSPTSPGDWMSRKGLIDPFPFLQAWKAGDDITPPRISP